MGIFDSFMNIIGASAKASDDIVNADIGDFTDDNGESYECPICGSEMMYVGGLLEYECPSCGAEGSLEYDDINKVNYVSIADDDDYDDMPAGCAACGGPYPDCMISCKLFDD